MWGLQGRLEAKLTVYLSFSSVTQSCPTPCDPVDCSMPGFPVHHQFPELAQTHLPFFKQTWLNKILDAQYLSLSQIKKYCSANHGWHRQCPAQITLDPLTFSSCLKEKALDSSVWNSQHLQLSSEDVGALPTRAESGSASELTPTPHQGALSQGLESAAEWKPSSPLQVRTNSEAYSRSRVPLWNQAGTSLEITPLCSSSSSLLWFPRFLTDFPRSTSPVNHVHMIPWLGAPLGTLELRNLLRN